MIKILNVSKEYGKGLQLYHMYANCRLNIEINIIFEHIYEEGLAECLRKAANAVDSMYNKEFRKYV